MAHSHNWKSLSGKNMLQCSSCDTVTSINTLLDNTIAETERKTTIHLLSKQLYDRSLKKDAHDKAYAWILANSKEDPLKVEPSKQGVLQI